MDTFLCAYIFLIYNFVCLKFVIFFCTRILIFSISNPFSAGAVFRRQNLTFEDDPRIKKNKKNVMALDP